MEEVDVRVYIALALFVVPALSLSLFSLFSFVLIFFRFSSTSYFAT